MTFITLEGPEGAGKSTQLSRLAEAVRAAGREVTVTREPGGTPEGEALRALLLDPDRAWSPLAEALLMNAARDAHLRGLIEPALEAGQVVLCDRFFDSTRAYQHEVGAGTLAAIHDAVVRRRPDLTLLLDLSVETGLERAEARGRADRFEGKGIGYHESVRRAFLAIAAAEPERIAVIDAAEGQDDVTKALLAAVHERLPGLLGTGDGPPSAA